MKDFKCPLQYGQVIHFESRFLHQSTLYKRAFVKSCNIYSEIFVNTLGNQLVHSQCSQSPQTPVHIAMTTNVSDQKSLVPTLRLGTSFIQGKTFQQFNLCHLFHATFLHFTILCFLNTDFHPQIMHVRRKKSYSQKRKIDNFINNFS